MAKIKKKVVITSIVDITIDEECMKDVHGENFQSLMSDEFYKKLASEAAGRTTRAADIGLVIAVNEIYKDSVKQYPASFKCDNFIAMK